MKKEEKKKEKKREKEKKAEAERERRAKVIHAEGEFQASQKIADAATVIATAPNAMQLRFLQTLVEVAAEKNSTMILPVPIDILGSLKDFLDRGAAKE